MFICQGTIQTTLNFLSSPTPSNTLIPFSANLITKDLPGRTEGFIYANVTSLPSNANLTFAAVALNASIEVFFPRQTFVGSWDVATVPDGDFIRALVSEEDSAGGMKFWNQDGRTSWKGETTVNGTKGGGSSTINLDAGRGFVELGFGRQTSWGW